MQIQTLDNSSRGDPAYVDPDLPPELRAALQAERREQQQQRMQPPAHVGYRPYGGGFPGAGPAPRAQAMLRKPARLASSLQRSFCSFMEVADPKLSSAHCMPSCDC